jgi:hypothetical protein
MDLDRCRSAASDWLVGTHRYLFILLRFIKQNLKDEIHAGYRSTEVANIK